MASFFLAWNPAKKITSGQTIQYKLNTSSTWTTKAVIGSKVDSYSVDGLLPNMLYNFRIIATCQGNIKSTQVVNGNTLTCPTITSSILYNNSSISIAYQITAAINTDVTKYIVELYNAVGTKLTYNQHLAPFTNLLTGSFSVNQSGDYHLKIKTISGIYTKNCNSVMPLQVCISINNISATIS